jgi:hypothetical protein
VTVNAAEPLIVPEVAVIAVVPWAKEAARPPLLTVATALADEVHCAVLVRFCVLPSLYVPVAANCSASPTAIAAVVGVTEIEASTVGLTLRVAEPLIVPEAAVIVAVPCAKPVATPLLFTVAIEAAEELHCAVLVRFWVVPSLYFPVAVNCWLLPEATDAEAGVTETEVRIPAVTVNVAEPPMVPDLAVMEAVPFATPVAKPPALTVATEPAEEFHLTVLVKFCVLPLE